MAEFFNSGSTDQGTIDDNSRAFRKYRLRSRVLVDVSKCDPSSTLWGSKTSFPLGVAPTGLQGMAHPEGEIATSRACVSRSVPMAISTFSNCSVGDIVRIGKNKHGDTHYAIQLYTMRDTALQERLIARAEAAGCKAIFLTGDSPVLGVRYNEWRNDFRTPAGLEYPNLEWSSKHVREQTHDSKFASFNDDAHNWERDIPRLRRLTNMQIWIKGVLTAEDAELAVKAGCDGIIVSNHGGRQLDGVPASIDALPECVEVAKGRIGIHIDGGFRRGSEIFKALALGAEMVWVGRPALWGLAYDGQAGVEKMLDVYQDEFRRCMALCGCKSIAEINKACLARITSDGLLARL